MADHRLALFHGASGIAAGVGGGTGVAGHLHDGRFQLGQGITDLPGVARLAFGTMVQRGAHAGQGVAAARDLLGVVTNGADQFH
ncbi:hypothetical protein D3C76_859720 [compost metagenome]